jgi:phosphomannomutase/phosphoglucomutase
MGESDLAPLAPAVDSQEDGIPAHIFLADCIRGDADTELTDELVEQLGLALAVLAQRQGVGALALGYDSRPSSKRIRTTLIKALLGSGIDIVEVGEVPTPLVHYAAHNSAAQSSVMITGGHGAVGFNGLKIQFNQQPLTTEDIQSLLTLVREGHRLQGVGRTSKEDIASHYIDQLSLDISLALPLKLVIDCDFGSSANIAPALFEAIDCEVITVNHPGDGERDPDWQLSTALSNLGVKVRESGADLGVLFDSDGDRLHTVTETGRVVDTDQLLMLLAQDALERNPGVDVVYDAAFSKHFGGFIARQGGRAVQTASGARAVRERLLASNALLGSDFAGHIIFADRWYNFDDALYALARLLELLAAASSSYEGLIGALPKSVATPELLLPLATEVASPLLTKLAESPTFSSGRLTTVDGVRVDYPHGWGLVRYAPLDRALALRFEGDDASSLERVQTSFREVLQGVAPELNLPF